MNNLDEEELEILQVVELGNIEPAENAVDIQANHRKYAEAMFEKAPGAIHLIRTTKT